MEFLVLASRYVKSERERVVMQAVMEAAETRGAERVVTRRGNVYCIGVYIREGTRRIWYMLTGKKIGSGEGFAVTS